MTEVIKENYISRTTGDSPGTGPGVWSPGQAKTRAAGPWCFFFERDLILGRNQAPFENNLGRVLLSFLEENTDGFHAFWVEM